MSKDFEVEGFMCSTDFWCELGGVDTGMWVYSSLEDMKKRNPTCTELCGVVKVAVRFVEQVTEGNRDNG